MAHRPQKKLLHFDGSLVI